MISKSNTGLISGLLIVFLGILFIDWSNPPQWLLFLGSFHTLLVHFPIALLLVAGLLELAGRSPGRSTTYRSTVDFLLLLGAGSAIAAAAAGFLFSLQGSYDGWLVSFHQYLGLSVVVGSVALVLLRTLNALRKAYVFILTGTVLAVIMTSHLGATLAHGSGYLTRYMPGPLKSLIGIFPDSSSSRGTLDPESAVIFMDLIEPILETKCIKCHGEEKQEGGLRLNTAENITRGGDSGPILVPGHPDQSDIFRRITLPLYHRDRMPPDGEAPLPVEETELIRWWIEQDASFERKVSDARGVPASVQTVLNRLSVPPEERKKGIFALSVAAPDPAVITRLQEEGYALRLIAQDSPFLEVDLSRKQEPLEPEDLESLRPLFQQMAWLDLSNSAVGKGVLSAVAQMPHLTRLYLQNTGIRDEDLGDLKNLQYLEYLNLYGTLVTNDGLKHLSQLASLRSIYLWQTQVTAEGAARLEQEIPELVTTLAAAPLDAPSDE